ncbi:hypothetical protein BaRGS_00030225, partial [Batillaria attramentaria]
TPRKSAKGDNTESDRLSSPLRATLPGGDQSPTQETVSTPKDGHHCLTGFAVSPAGGEVSGVEACKVAVDIQVPSVKDCSVTSLGSPQGGGQMVNDSSVKASRVMTECNSSKLTIVAASQRSDECNPEAESFSENTHTSDALERNTPSTNPTKMRGRCDSFGLLEDSDKSPERSDKCCSVFESLPHTLHVSGILEQNTRPDLVSVCVHENIISVSTGCHTDRKSNYSPVNLTSVASKPLQKIADGQPADKISPQPTQPTRCTSKLDVNLSHRISRAWQRCRVIRDDMDLLTRRCDTLSEQLENIRNHVVTKTQGRLSLNAVPPMPKLHKTDRSVRYRSLPITSVSSTTPEFTCENNPCVKTVVKRSLSFKENSIAGTPCANVMSSSTEPVCEQDVLPTTESHVPLFTDTSSQTQNVGSVSTSADENNNMPALRSAETVHAICPASSSSVWLEIGPDRYFCNNGSDEVGTDIPDNEIRCGVLEPKPTAVQNLPCADWELTKPEQAGSNDSTAPQDNSQVDSERPVTPIDTVEQQDTNSEDSASCLTSPLSFEPLPLLSTTSEDALQFKDVCSNDLRYYVPALSRIQSSEGMTEWSSPQKTRTNVLSLKGASDADPQNESLCSNRQRKDSILTHLDLSNKLTVSDVTFVDRDAGEKVCDVDMQLKNVSLPNTKQHFAGVAESCIDPDVTTLYPVNDVSQSRTEDDTDGDRVDVTKLCPDISMPCADTVTAPVDITNSRDKVTNSHVQVDDTCGEKVSQKVVASSLLSKQPTSSDRRVSKGLLPTPPRRRHPLLSDPGFSSCCPHVTSCHQNPRKHRAPVLPTTVRCPALSTHASAPPRSDSYPMGSICVDAHMSPFTVRVVCERDGASQHPDGRMVSRQLGRKSFRLNM